MNATRTEFQIYGQPMKMIRIMRGVQAKAVAEAIGVVKSHISMCETGHRRLSPEKTAEFLAFMNVSEEEAKEFIRTLGY